VGEFEILTLGGRITLTAESMTTESRISIQADPLPGDSKPASPHLLL